MLFSGLIFRNSTQITSRKRKIETPTGQDFGPENGFNQIHLQSYFCRILCVKVPRYRNGHIAEFDVFDLKQSKLLLPILKKLY